MSDLQELFESEGVDDADGLLSWATQRAASLLDELGDDGELSALLVDGGTAGEPVPVAPSSLPGGEVAHADEVTQPRARVRPDPAPLPPIPSKARAAAPAEDEDEEEIEELDIEELDVEELELIEDEDEDEDEAEDDGQADDAAGTAQVEGGAEASPTPAAPAQSFGPPDGTDEVPEWKAALMSAQTDDEQAAARVKEASSAEPLPEAPEAEEPRGLAGRLEAEDDEISQHSMDFSDLDTDDE